METTGNIKGMAIILDPSSGAGSQQLPYHCHTFKDLSDCPVFFGNYPLPVLIITIGTTALRRVLSVTQGIKKAPFQELINGARTQI